MDYEGLVRLASEPRTKMIYQCNPHTPVGRVWGADKLRRLGDISKCHKVLVVADEIHGGITYSGHKHTPFASLGVDYADNTIRCISPAKRFNIASCCAAFAVI